MSREGKLGNTEAMAELLGRPILQMHPCRCNANYYQYAAKYLIDVHLR